MIRNDSNGTLPIILFDNLLERFFFYFCGICCITHYKLSSHQFKIWATCQFTHKIVITSGKAIALKIKTKKTTLFISCIFIFLHFGSWFTTAKRVVILNWQGNYQKTLLIICPFTKMHTYMLQQGKGVEVIIQRCLI